MSLNQFLPKKTWSLSFYDLDRQVGGLVLTCDFHLGLSNDVKGLSNVRSEFVLGLFKGDPCEAFLLGLL